MDISQLRVVVCCQICCHWFDCTSCVYGILPNAAFSVLLDTLERVKKSLIFSRKRAYFLIIFPLFCYIYICKVERFSISLALCRSSCYWHFGEQNGVVRRRKNRHKKSVKKSLFFEKNPQIAKKFVIFNIKVNELDNWKISPISSMFDYFF